MANHNPFPRFRRRAGPASFAGLLLYVAMLTLVLLAVIYTPLGRLFP